VIHLLFHRFIGGNQAKGGRSGGAEKDIVGVIVLIAGIFVGNHDGHRKGSGAQS
jgi:hypothetical protein